MKFLLRHDLGETAIREIGSRLRAVGSGHHWIERFRGDIFVNAGDERDERILRNEFSGMVDPVDEPNTGPGR